MSIIINYQNSSIFTLAYCFKFFELDTTISIEKYIFDNNVHSALSLIFKKNIIGEQNDDEYITCTDTLKGLYKKNNKTKKGLSIADINYDFFNGVEITPEQVAILEQMGIEIPGSEQEVAEFLPNDEMNASIVTGWTKISDNNRDIDGWIVGIKGNMSNYSGEAYYTNLDGTTGNNSERKSYGLCANINKNELCYENTNIDGLNSGANVNYDLNSIETKLNIGNFNFDISQTKVSGDTTRKITNTKIEFDNSSQSLNMFGAEEIAPAPVPALVPGSREMPSGNLFPDMTLSDPSLISGEIIRNPYISYQTVYNGTNTVNVWSSGADVAVGSTGLDVTLNYSNNNTNTGFSYNGTDAIVIPVKEMMDIYMHAGPLPEVTEAPDSEPEFVRPDAF